MRDGKEITIHKEMLRAQLKANEEERSTVSSELHDRIGRIDKLRKRWAYTFRNGFVIRC